MFLKNLQTILFSCFILLPSLAVADETVFSFYDISGNNARELRKQLDDKGPSDKTGERFDALTETRVSYTYRYRPISGGCRIVDFSARLETTITMPRWIQGDITSSLGKKWQKYYQALYAHELGHRDFGLALFKEIEMAGRNFETGKGCDFLAQELEIVTKSIFDKYERLNQQYDNETDHGVSQGASFH